MQSLHERETWCDQYTMDRYNEKRAVIRQRFKS